MACFISQASVLNKVKREHFFFGRNRQNFQIDKLVTFVNLKTGKVERKKEKKNFTKFAKGRKRQARRCCAGFPVPWWPGCPAVVTDGHSGAQGVK